VRTCEAIDSAICLANLTSPSSGATIASVEGCAEALPKWMCSDYLFVQNTPPACEPQSGLLAINAPCGTHSQCRSSFCAVAPGAACGTCAPQPAVGDSCAHLASCGANLTCVAATQKCQQFAQVGGSCMPGTPCIDGLTCVGYSASSGTPGTCQRAVITSGTACNFLGAGCDLFSGLACNAQTLVCGTAQVASTGAACGLVANQMALCAASGDCTGGVCAAAPGLGDPCDLANGPACVTATRCVVSKDGDGGTRGTCQVPNGAACQ
jgi:hypothetical protein